jgi:septation ring formation regulator EzrA
MDEKKEIKKLMSIGKKVIPKKVYKKIKLIKDLSEKRELLKYSIRVNLELKFEDIKNKIEKMEQNGKNTFFINLKMNVFKSKIKLFSATLNDSDYIKAIEIFKEVEREMKHVI